MDAVIVVEVIFVGGVALSFGAWELWSLRRERLRREVAEQGRSSHDAQPESDSGPPDPPP